MSREKRISEVFVELADTMVAEFDVLDLLLTLADRTVDLLAVDAAGLMLADERGELQVLASTSHEVRLLEIFELQNDEGPCLDCFKSGLPVVNVRNGDATSRWPKFSAVTDGAGYQRVHALPLRLRSHTIGAMNMLCVEDKILGEDDIALGQALADVATIGLLQERAVRQKELLAEQLQTALNSRILIEQAKGVLAERAGIDVDDAFRRMRAYSRQVRYPLGAVAAAVIEGSIDKGELHKALGQPKPGEAGSAVG